MTCCQSIKAKIAAYDSAKVLDATLTAMRGGPHPQGPKPPKPIPLDATEQQKLCAELSYILYLLEYDDPQITPAQAWSNYVANFAGCFGDPE